MLQAGVLQLYLDETPAKALSCEFWLVSQNNYLQNIYTGWFLLFFLKYYFLLCEELQDNEVQRFSNNANFNQFEIKTRKLHVMWRDFYLHEAIAPGLLLGKI